MTKFLCHHITIDVIKISNNLRSCVSNCSWSLLTEDAAGKDRLQEGSAWLTNCLPAGKTICISAVPANKFYKEILGHNHHFGSHYSYCWYSQIFRQHLWTGKFVRRWGVGRVRDGPRWGSTTTKIGKLDVREAWRTPWADLPTPSTGAWPNMTPEGHEMAFATAANRSPPHDPWPSPRARLRHHKRCD